MPTGGMWKAVVLGELTLNAPPFPGVTHILQGSPGRGAGDWKAVPGGHYLDGLVLTQLREQKDKGTASTAPQREQTSIKQPNSEKNTRAAT